jgi:hydrogenase maturation protease
MPSAEAPIATAVIGLGNPLMGDDGVGLVALERLRARGVPSRVQLVDGGTWGMSLLPLLESTDRLLILDAIDRGLPPGTVVELTGDEVPRHLELKLSPHQVDLRDVLALATLRETRPAELVAIGIQPERVAMSTELSDAVQAALDPMVARAGERLAAWELEPAGRREVEACTS